jgi:hypothetical protein
MSHNFEQLKEVILILSEEKRDFTLASLEWHLKYVRFAKMSDRQHCSCGKNPIIEVCVIENTKNLSQCDVGNVCIKKFMPELKSWAIFQGLESICKRRAPNKTTDDFLRDQGILTFWEWQFFKDMFRKQTFTAKQIFKLNQVTSKVISKMNLKGKIIINADVRIKDFKDDDTEEVI